MKGIDLPVYFKNDDYETNEIIGKETPYKDCDVRDVRFYIIGAFSEYRSDQDGKVYGIIHSSNSDFISPLNKKQLIERYES